MLRVAPGRMALVGLLGLAGLLSGSRGAGAATCAFDTVPAATLLLPYFEVDLGNPSGRTTLFSIGNAGAAAALAHVVLWTDLAVPTMVFDVYLTGFDVETVNLRDLFNGLVPQTADDARDPANEVSPRGDLSQDATFPDCAGFLPPAAPGPAFVEHLRFSHQGFLSSLFGRCAGLRYNDGIARGFVTVDVATRCSPLLPGEAGYFGPGGVAGTANVLWGDFLYVDPAGNFAQGENLVRIEADPARFAEDRRTFYGWTGSAGADGREPLGARWASRFVNGGAFAGGTDLVVWRAPPVAGRTFSCAVGHPNWYPLPKEEVVSFDEEETPEVPTCFNPFPIPLPCPAVFPAAAQRRAVDSDDFTISFPFGWAWLGFDPPPTGDNRLGQTWVGTTLSASGRYSAGLEGTALDAGCDACARGRQAQPGRLCVRGPLEAGLPVEVQVFPKGCFSSSCTERIEASCSVTQRGEILALDTRICLESTGQLSCTPDCSGGGFAQCSSAGLPAGSYEARAGELRVAFTVPGTVPPEGLCAGDPF